MMSVVYHETEQKDITAMLKNYYLVDNILLLNRRIVESSDCWIDWIDWIDWFDWFSNRLKWETYNKNPAKNYYLVDNILLSNRRIVEMLNRFNRLNRWIRLIFKSIEMRNIQQREKQEYGKVGICSEVTMSKM